MKFFKYKTESNGSETTHFVNASEIISFHIYSTDLGHACQVIFKEKVKQEVPTYSNKGRVTGNKMETINASIYLKKAEEIKSLLTALDLEVDYELKDFDDAKVNELQEVVEL
jgi:hypothetical protein